MVPPQHATGSHSTQRTHGVFEANNFSELVLAIINNVLLRIFVESNVTVEEETLF